MKHELSFGYINLLSNNIAEVIVNNNVVMTLEMVEEYDAFLMSHFHERFGLLINKINQYSYTFEAKLNICSVAGLSAMAVVLYNLENKESTNNLINIRKVDNWNIKQFSGLELGWQQGLSWLKHELSEKAK